MEKKLAKEFTKDELADIRASYRDAADPKKQISILADLYAVPRAEICSALGIEDVKPKAPKKLRAYDKSVKDAVVRAVLLDNEPRAEVAERFGVPIGNINAWVAKAKKRQAEFLNYDPQSNDKSHEPNEVVTEYRTVPSAGFNPEKAVAELKVGIAGLQEFFDSFAGTDLFTNDQWEMFDMILSKAEGFAAGMETAVKLMEVGK